MKKHLPEIAIIMLLIAVSLCGIFSLDFTKATTYINQYGDTIKLFGSGIYKADSYFKAPIFIGTDFAVLGFIVPLFISFLISEIKANAKNNSTSAPAAGDNKDISNTNIFKPQLHLISIEATSLYYAASLCFGVKYNRIFILYVLLFTLTLFTFIIRIRQVASVKLNYAPTKADSIFLIILGISLCIAWWPDIIPTIINGTSLSLIENYTTEPTYILDLGIISPLCFMALYLMKKRNSLGIVIYSILLQMIIGVAIMMITQSIVQNASGVDIPLPALISKAGIFVVLGIIARLLNKRLYKKISLEESTTSTQAARY